MKRLVIFIISLVIMAGGAEGLYRANNYFDNTMEPNQASPHIFSAFGTLYFWGRITKNSADEVVKIYQNAVFKPKTLQMRSTGGNAVDAIAIGNFIRDKKMDVELKGACFSACANYILPAGEKTYISDDTFVGWHGSLNSLIFYSINLHRYITYKEAEKMDNKLPYLKTKERVFYKSVGVSYLLPICGQLQGKGGVEGLFYYKPEDLMKFGLHNIVFDDNQKWVFHQTKMQIGKAAFCNNMGAL